MNVLVIAPHPDDESIGPGGTIARHVASGDGVYILVLTSGERGFPSHDSTADHARRSLREAECAEASRRLGASLLPFARLPDGALSASSTVAAHALADALAALRPERVYLPHEADEHEDHRAVASILRAAVQRSGFVPWALGYEVWSPMPWFDQVEDISDVLDRKLHAIAAYPSQLAQFAYDRAARGLAMYRGAIAARCEAAEVFCSMDVG